MFVDNVYQCFTILVVIVSEGCFLSEVVINLSEWWLIFLSGGQGRASLTTVDTSLNRI